LTVTVLPTIEKSDHYQRKNNTRRSLVLQISGSFNSFSHSSVLPSLDIHDGRYDRWCFRILTSGSVTSGSNRDHRMCSFLLELVLYSRVRCLVVTRSGY
jgi:hypothetical protein